MAVESGVLGAVGKEFAAGPIGFLSTLSGLVITAIPVAFPQQVATISGGSPSIVSDMNIFLVSLGVTLISAGVLVILLRKRKK